ncbi:CrcB family protein [Cryobacterium arcticum]|uniref:Fluoride-specific ion channel FluC n=1 Tax=Cryobacterium arcticum TaxID=670052 RepID=A0A318A0N3_9MICO|nr:CrcB family protein [Cryobacterium arcticum]PXA71796.1 hypothetical protein CTB96_02405 [Cryobacterium arcticum]
MAAAPAAPVHLRWQYLALVFAGGTVGTAARELLAITVPPVAGVAVVIVGINVVGAFLLGLLLETLARRGPDDGRRRSMRLLLGTGVLGGFTTYSALATDTSLLLAENRLGTALLYALGTLLVGAFTAWAGILTGAALHGRRTIRRSGADAS